MDINNAASSRAQFYDRNAEAGLLKYSTSSAPHGLTVQDTYTVPANRKTIVNSISVQLIKTIVAGAVGTAYIKLTYTPFGGASETVYRINLMTATLYDHVHESLAPSFVMYPGDVLELESADNSGGGFLRYGVYAMYAEFDF